MGFDGATTFSPGTRVTAADGARRTLADTASGLMVHPTLIEAARCHLTMTSTLPNLTALAV